LEPLDDIYAFFLLIVIAFSPNELERVQLLASVQGKLLTQRDCVLKLRKLKHNFEKNFTDCQEFIMFVQGLMRMILYNPRVPIDATKVYKTLFPDEESTKNASPLAKLTFW